MQLTRQCSCHSDCHIPARMTSILFLHNIIRLRNLESCQHSTPHFQHFTILGSTGKFSITIFRLSKPLDFVDSMPQTNGCTMLERRPGPCCIASRKSSPRSRQLRRIQQGISSQQQGCGIDSLFRVLDERFERSSVPIQSL